MELEAGEAAHAVGLGHELVAVKSHGGVGFGAPVVVEHELGQCAEVVGLGQVGLGLGGEVEVVDGEHVVVHAQHVATDVQHLLGVDLGLDADKRE